MQVYETAVKPPAGEVIAEISSPPCSHGESIQLSAVTMPEGEVIWLIVVLIDDDERGRAAVGQRHGHLPGVAARVGRAAVAEGDRVAPRVDDLASSAGGVVALAALWPSLVS